MFTKIQSDCLGFLLSNTFLGQRCPTHSPLATCGEWDFFWKLMYFFSKSFELEITSDYGLIITYFHYTF